VNCVKAGYKVGINWAERYNVVTWKHQGCVRSFKCFFCVRLEDVRSEKSSFQFSWTIYSVLIFIINQTFQLLTFHLFQCCLMNLMSF